MTRLAIAMFVSRGLRRSGALPGSNGRRRRPLATEPVRDQPPFFSDSGGAICAESRKARHMGLSEENDCKQLQSQKKRNP